MKKAHKVSALHPRILRLLDPYVIWVLIFLNQTSESTGRHSFFSYLVKFGFVSL
jgi:hypothetical protein